MWYIKRTPPWYVDRDYQLEIRSARIIRYEYSLYARASRSGCIVPRISGRVDMLTSPVPAARAAVVTGAWVESKHDMYLIHAWKCGSSSFIFTHPPEDEKKKKEKSIPGTWCGTCKHPTDYTNQRYGRLSCA